jgi:hypothetical protein
MQIAFVSIASGFNKDFILKKVSNYFEVSNSITGNSCIYVIRCNTTKKPGFNNQSFNVILFVLSLEQSNLQKIVICFFIELKMEADHW